MSSAHPNPDATTRFFQINELLTLFLELAPPRVLFNCARVCRLWNEIITDSQTCQQHLFLQPIEHDSNAEPITPTLNPLIWERFGPVLATSTSPHHSTQSNYEDLSRLPWAQDGLEMDARARQAFAREEASWRFMLISQPPIKRLDWWHTWSVSPQITSTQHSDDNEDDWGNSGWGHQDLPDQNLTIGLLWDLLESRLFRNCTSQIIYFPSGQKISSDPFATEEEKRWADRPGNQHRGLTDSMPRVKLLTEQIWDKRPGANVGFNFSSKKWEVLGDRDMGHDYLGDGFNALRHDCRYDFGYAEEEFRRWSRHEDFWTSEIGGESSGSS